MGMGLGRSRGCIVSSLSRSVLVLYCGDGGRCDRVGNEGDRVVAGVVYILWRLVSGWFQ